MKGLSIAVASGVISLDQVQEIQLRVRIKKLSDRIDQAEMEAESGDGSRADLARPEPVPFAPSSVRLHGESHEHARDAASPEAG